jgi:hypothetical protein
MNRRILVALALPALSLSTACSSSGDKTRASTQAVDAGQVWTRIIEGSWTVQPGQELTRDCHKVQMTEDTYISAIRPVAPEGTHHTLLTMGDAQSDCTVAAATTGILYAAGLGSPGLTLPKGVAIKIPKGTYLNLGLHIYNPTNGVLSGTSAMEVVLAKAEDVEYEADSLAAGPLNFSLPPGERTTISDDCTVDADQTAFNLFPHMHQLGVHITTTLTSGGNSTVVHDGDYHFNEQYQIPLDPELKLGVGDKITTTCTYENTLGKTVGFGESSDTEMCFSILFRYPAQHKAFCSDSAGSRPKPTLNGPPCATAGATGNDKGVGQACTAGGHECTTGSTLCLADYTKGTFGNFCTLLCKSDADCGQNATCAGTSQPICVPNACLSTFESSQPDAGAKPDGG